MLSYLVTSPARRRLLELLWREGARGTAAELGRDAFVSFATAYRELRAMLRHGLVTQSWEDGVAVYAANNDHPEADVLRRLTAAKRREAATADMESDQVRARLAARGAPVRSQQAPRETTTLEDDVVDGVQLARRDPATARALPVLLHRVASELDKEALASKAHANGVAHVLGFFLSLTARLGGDRGLASLARELRDHRVRDQPLFLLPPGPRVVHFPRAAAWGFNMTMDEEAFRSTFRRFAPEARG